MVCNYLPVPEKKKPMTFQIGMVSPEGVLLASDRKITNLMGYRFGRQTPKIEVYETENIAHCSSGDGFCETFTTVVRDQAKAGKQFSGTSFIEVRQALIECVYIAREKEQQYRQSLAQQAVAVSLPPICTGGSTMLVFRKDGLVTLWTVDTLAASPTASPVDAADKAIAGDTNSPAVFLLEKYFDRVPNNLVAMIPLAVHAVLMAKSDFVEGLAVGLFTRKTFRILTTKELKPFVRRSKQLDSEVLKLLIKPTASSIAP